MEFLSSFPPADDEILSSWAVRISRSNRFKKLHTFTQLLLPGRPAAWARDIDRLHDPALVEQLAIRTGASRERVVETTLWSLEGVLFNRDNSADRMSWVRPIGVYHRLRRTAGLQYCPLCLDEHDPFYRRAWRLGFVTACARHGILLRERCPRCREPVNFHRVPYDRRLSMCSACGSDIRRGKHVPADRSALRFQEDLSASLSNGWARMGEYGPVYSFAYFAVVHQLCRIVASGHLALKLRILLRALGGLDIGEPVEGTYGEIERLSPGIRHDLLRAAAILIQNWPNTFLDYCERGGIWSAWLVNGWPRRHGKIPFPYADPVRRLNRSLYEPNREEVASIRRYCRKRGLHPTHQNMKRVAGRDSQAFDAA